MPETTLRRGDVNSAAAAEFIDDPASNSASDADLGDRRAALRLAIANHKGELERLDALTQGLRRAQDQARNTNYQLTTAQAHIERLNREESINLAYRFVNGEASDSQQLAQTHATLERAQDELTQIVRVETALSAEIGESQRRLQSRQRELHEAVAVAICSSQEFADLLSLIEEAWQWLRSLRIVFNETITACRGNMPAALMSRGQAAQPLEERVGYPINEELVGSWRAALALLPQDADAALPSASH
jgi:hypothetical protein